LATAFFCEATLCFKAGDRVICNGQRPLTRLRHEASSYSLDVFDEHSILLDEAHKI